MNTVPQPIWIYLLHHIITIVLICLLLGLFSLGGDLILKFLRNPDYNFYRPLIAMLFFYMAFVYLMLYASFWIVGIIVIEAVYRAFQLHFRIFQVWTLLLAAIIAYQYKNETYSFYMHQGKEAKQVVVILLAGLLYPYLSDYLFSKLNKAFHSTS